MVSKIPAEFIEPILQKAASGFGCREISRWLKSEHGVTASHMTVARLVKSESASRATVATTVARTKLAKHVSSDLDRLELFAKKAIRIARTVEGEPEVWVKVARELRGILVEKLKIAGANGEVADESHEPTPADAARVVRELFGRVTPAAVATPAAERAGEPEAAG